MPKNDGIREKTYGIIGSPQKKGSRLGCFRFEK